METQNIKIYYKGDFNTELDEKIRNAFSKIDYWLIGSGFNSLTQERDLEFEYKSTTLSK